MSEALTLFLWDMKEYSSVSLNELYKIYFTDASLKYQRKFSEQS